MKTTLYKSTVWAVLILFGFSSCKKDTTAPVITLTDGATITLSLNTTDGDPGATATDDEDGNVSATITSDFNQVVDVDQAGTYKVTYSVSDKAGNKGTATRTVNVENDAADLEGTYDATETSASGGIPDHVETITASETQNNRLVISNFASFSFDVYVDVNGTQITVPQQVVDGETISGDGQIINGTTIQLDVTSASGLIISLELTKQ